MRIPKCTVVRGCENLRYKMLDLECNITQIRRAKVEGVFEVEVDEGGYWIHVTSTIMTNVKVR